MSKIIASAAIMGTYKIVERAQAKWRQAKGRWGAGGDVAAVFNRCCSLLPPPNSEEPPAH